MTLTQKTQFRSVQESAKVKAVLKGGKRSTLILQQGGEAME